MSSLYIPGSSGGGAVASVNGQTGAVVLDAGDIGVAGAVRTLGPFSFVFNTPNLAAGITAYTPAVDDLFFGYYLEITTQFNGTSVFQFRQAGGDPLVQGIDLTDVANLSATSTNLRVGAAGGATMSFVTGTISSSRTTNPMKYHVDSDGAGGATGATAGAGRAWLFVATGSPT